MKQEHMEQPITMGALLEYTHDFLIPQFASLLKVELHEHSATLRSSISHELKSYIDDKLADQTADIFARIHRSKK